LALVLPPTGEEEPTAYGSQTLSKNYAQVEKEALAIVYGINNLHQCIYGRKLTLVTDHKPLTTILNPKHNYQPWQQPVYSLCVSMKLDLSSNMPMLIVCHGYH